MKQNMMRKMACFFVLAFACSAFSTNAMAASKSKTLTEKRYDLDGDGKKDKITVVFDDFQGYSYNQFTIQIGKQVLVRKGETIRPKIFVVDIDKNDGEKEVMICDDGSSDDPVSFRFSYSFGQLFELGKLEGNLLNTRSTFKINGDGTVTTPVRCDVLHTWWRVTTFRRNTWTQRFELVEQGVYDSAKRYPVTVIKTFKAYDKKSASAATYTLNKGQTITINGTDDKRWVRFINSNGKEGWILMDAKYDQDIKGYGVATEYLNGLEMFD